MKANIDKLNRTAIYRVPMHASAWSGHKFHSFISLCLFAIFIFQTLGRRTIYKRRHTAPCLRLEDQMCALSCCSSTMAVCLPPWLPSMLSSETVKVNILHGNLNKTGTVVTAIDALTRKTRNSRGLNPRRRTTGH